MVFWEEKDLNQVISVFSFKIILKKYRFKKCFH